MILPSDSDSPSNRKDGSKKSKGGPGSNPGKGPKPGKGKGSSSSSGSGSSGAGPGSSGQVWWHVPDPSGAGGYDPDLHPGQEPQEELPPPLQSVAGPGWRTDLYKDLVESLHDLAAIEDPDDEFSPPEPPDLYTFFGELAALRHELRHQGKRTADGLGQLDKTLAPLLAAGLPAKAQSAAAAVEAWPLETSLALVSAWDLLPHAASGRAFAATLEPLLKAAGLTRIETAGRIFDPALMTIAGVEPADSAAAAGPPAKTPAGASRSRKKSAPASAPEATPAARLVVRETTAGFLRSGVLLRPAAVIVTA